MTLYTRIEKSIDVFYNSEKNIEWRFLSETMN